MDRKIATEEEEEEEEEEEAIRGIGQLMEATPRSVSGECRLPTGHEYLNLGLPSNSTEQEKVGYRDPTTTTSSLRLVSTSRTPSCSASRLLSIGHGEIGDPGTRQTESWMFHGPPSSLVHFGRLQEFEVRRQSNTTGSTLYPSIFCSDASSVDQ